MITLGREAAEQKQYADAAGDLAALNRAVEYIDVHHSCRDEFAASLRELALRVGTPRGTRDFEKARDLLPAGDTMFYSVPQEVTLVMPPGAIDAFHGLFRAAKYMVTAAREEGHERGSSLLASLATGETSIEEWNRRTLGQQP